MCSRNSVSWVELGHGRLEARSSRRTACTTKRGKGAFAVGGLETLEPIPKHRGLFSKRAAITLTKTTCSGDSQKKRSEPHRRFTIRDPHQEDSTWHSNMLAKKKGIRGCLRRQVRHRVSTDERDNWQLQKNQQVDRKIDDSFGRREVGGCACRTAGQPRCEKLHQAGILGARKLTVSLQLGAIEEAQKRRGKGGAAVRGTRDGTRTHTQREER